MSIKARGAQFASAMQGNVSYDIQSHAPVLGEAASTFVPKAAAAAFGPVGGFVAQAAMNWKPSALSTHTGAAYGVSVGDTGTGLSGAYQGSYSMGATGQSRSEEPEVQARPSLADTNDALNAHLGRPSIARQPSKVSSDQFAAINQNLHALD